MNDINEVALILMIFEKLFLVFFFIIIIWGIPFQILTPTREKAFRLTLSRNSLVWKCSEVEARALSMNTKNSREKFQNIFRSSDFFFTSYITVNHWADSQYRACKGRIFALTKNVSRGRLFQQNIVNAVLVFEAQEFGQGKFYARYPKR